MLVSEPGSRSFEAVAERYPWPHGPAGASLKSLSDPSRTVPTVGGPLNDQDRAVLEFAARTYRHDGHQQAAIRAELGMSATRFWQRLRAVVRDPAALEVDPVTVHRYERLMARQARVRSARSTA